MSEERKYGGNRTGKTLETIKVLEAEVERLRMQLVACDVACLANTEKSREEQRIKPDNPYCSETYKMVCDAVDREIALRQENAAMKEELGDIMQTHREVMDERCPTDEQHCTCVPFLREEIAALVKALDEATTCTYCDGKGAYLIAEDVDSSYHTECENCGGSGRYYDNITPDSRALCKRVLDKKEGR